MKVDYKIYILLIVLGFVLSCKKKKEVKPYPQLSLNSSLVLEEGTDAANTIRIAVQSDGEIVTEEGNPKVNYSIQHISTDENDFTGTQSGSLEFTENNQTKYIEITTNPDDVYEPNKQFIVRISGGENARLNSAKKSVTITLIDDDECVCGECEGYETVTTYDGLTLDWLDEFDASTIDNSIWGYDLGAGGWWNAQLQNFTNASSNSYIENGELVLKATKVNNDYISAQLKTQGKKFINKGRLDIRAKFPFGKGVWPRIWLKPEENVHGTWPQSGELIMSEVYGHIPSVVTSLVDYGKDGNDKEQKSYAYVSSHNNLFDCYHIFSMVWEDDNISFLLDDNMYMTLTSSEVNQAGYTYPYDADFHLIFSMAIGGTKVGEPNDSDLPAEMRIDYVRYYKQN